jgi:hypothetical protein
MSYWHTDQTPPDLTNNGSNWILVQAPTSDEELDREYCEITHTPPGAAASIIDYGDIEYPFDGSCFLLSNLATGQHTVTATAQYTGDNDAISVAVTQTKRFKVGGPTKKSVEEKPKAVPMTDLSVAPQILAASESTATKKWAVLQTPDFPAQVTVGRRTFTFKRCILKRLWTAGRTQKHLIVSISNSPNCQIILDDRQRKKLVAGAIYRAIGIYVNKSAPAGARQQRVKSADSDPVTFP